LSARSQKCTEDDVVGNLVNKNWRRKLDDERNLVPVEESCAEKDGGNSDVGNSDVGSCGRRGEGCGCGRKDHGVEEGEREGEREGEGRGKGEEEGGNFEGADDVVEENMVKEDDRRADPILVLTEVVVYDHAVHTVDSPAVADDISQVVRHLYLSISNVTRHALALVNSYSIYC